MRTSPRLDDYNRPLTGERALMTPPDHAIRHRPVNVSPYLLTYGTPRASRGRA
jgi:hypothetical protein